MQGGSDGEDVNDDSNANKGNESTTDCDSDYEADASSVQGPKEKPTPREAADGRPLRTKTAAWKDKQARISKVVGVKAKPLKAKAVASKKKAAAPSPKKRVTKGH